MRACPTLLEPRTWCCRFRMCGAPSDEKFPVTCLPTEEPAHSKLEVLASNGPAFLHLVQVFPASALRSIPYALGGRHGREHVFTLRVVVALAVARVCLI